MINDFQSPVGDINREFEEKEAIKIASSHGLEYVDIAHFPLNPDILQMIDEEDALMGKILPFHKNARHVKVAVVSVDSLGAKRVIRELQDLHFEVEVFVCSKTGFEAIVKLYQSHLVKRKTIELRNELSESGDNSLESAFMGFEKLAKNIFELTAAEALNEIELSALKVKASDIHLQPFSDKVMLRFRIDGILHDICEIETKPAQNLVNHIKYAGGMKSNLSHIPQDGHLSFEVNDRQVDLRVSTIPTEFVESVVMRVLDSRRGIKNFSDLGFDKFTEKKINSVLKKKNGMILVTGPTGSGKTTTLYSMLSELNHSERKLITLEDPIEYHLDNVTQSQVAANSDYNFSNGLKAILRHDPDVVLIGEIRDLETAKLTTEASLTGHIVLSSLHTNSALGAVSRLRNLGMESFNIASALNAVFAQRLLRKICPHCVSQSQSEIDDFKKFKESLNRIHNLYPELGSKIIKEKVKSLDANGEEIEISKTFLKTPVAVGCEKCSHTGFLGQTVITEVVLFDHVTQDLIAKDIGELDLFAEIRKLDPTFLTLFEDGIRKVLQGVTTIDEVYRVAG